MKKSIPFLLVCFYSLMIACNNPPKSKDEPTVTSTNATADSMTAVTHLYVKNFEAPPDPIPELEARKMHLNYLSSPNALRDGRDSTIGSFSVSKTDLNALYAAGKEGGMRIYFCLEPAPTGDYLSLIIVPRKKDLTNDLSVIINKVDPCPDICSKVGGKNDQSDLNFDRFGYKKLGLWLKPSRKTLSQWVDENEVRK